MAQSNRNQLYFESPDSQDFFLDSSFFSRDNQLASTCVRSIIVVSATEILKARGVGLAVGPAAPR